VGVATQKTKDTRMCFLKVHETGVVQAIVSDALVIFGLMGVAQCEPVCSNVCEFLRELCAHMK